MMSRLPWLNRRYRYQTPPPPPPPPPLGRFNSPSPPPPFLPIPPGFRPFSNAPFSPLYFRPSRVAVPLQYLPNEFYRRYIDRSLSPVAGRRGRHPRPSWRRRVSSSSASLPPDLRSPGRTPTSKTPDQEVRQHQVTHLHQACHSQPQAERSNDDTSVADNASNTEEGFKPRKLQKSVSGEISELEVLAVADDQEKEKQDQTGHQHQSTRGKEKAEWQTDQISVSGYASGDGGSSEGKLHELISSERVELEGSFFADSQDAEMLEGCYLHHPSQGQDKSREPCNQNFVMADAPGTAKGGIRLVDSQEMRSSMRTELDAPVLADFQEAWQDRSSNQPQPSPRKAKAKRQKDQMYTMEEDASSTSEGGEIRERKLQKLMSSEKNELEAAIIPTMSVKDSACDVLDEVDNTVPPIAQMTSSFHDQADSFSLTSSVLNWASTFDNVTSTGATHDEKMVKVGSYVVDQKYSTTMDAIIKKYGDIAEDCGNSSTMFRSYAVQGVCEVVEGLQIPLKELSHDRLKTYTCFVKEALVMGLNVKWLEERLDEVWETIDAIREYKRVRDARKVNAEKMKDLKKEIEVKDTENWKCENEVEESWFSFKEATLEFKTKKRAIHDIKSRCKAIPKRLLGGLY